MSVSDNTGGIPDWLRSWHSWVQLQFCDGGLKMAQLPLSRGQARGTSKDSLHRGQAALWELFHTFMKSEVYP